MTNFFLRLKRFGGIICGIVFLLSGLFKLMDPVGASLVMSEYYDFLHISFMEPTAKVMGTLLALAEAVIGIALVTGVWRRIIAYIACGMQGFFTILTLFLVIFNPEMDCGCFGEVIHLTHLETFIKNIVLCGLLAAYTFPVRALGTHKKIKLVSFSIVSISVLGFTIYSWLYLPMMDFTDFKPSAILLSAKEFSESDKQAYEVTNIIYEKDGVRKSFKLDEIPDSTWTFVSSEIVNNNQQDAAITLSIYNNNGEYFDHLAANGKVMVISVYDTDIKLKKWQKIVEFISLCKAEGFNALVLAAGQESEVDQAIKGMNPESINTLKSHLYFSDYKTLITMNRSNGGTTYFNEGHLICKWARLSTPDKEELNEINKVDETEVMADYDTKGSLTLQGFLLYIFAILLLL